MTKRTLVNKSKKSASGAKGGPSVGRGMNYQVDFAIEQTLDRIGRALCAPHRNWQVHLEPRASALGGLTTWDVGFDPDDMLFEIKLKPSRLDICEWIGRVAIDATVNSARTYHLVYSKGAGKHLEQLEQIIRIAVEANGERDVFQVLLHDEGVEVDGSYIEILGEQSHEVLRRMFVEQVPEYLLRSVSDFRARQLAGETGGRHLREFLFKKLHEAVPHRATFSISELIEEARNLGIPFQPQASVNQSDISDVATGAIIILQACKVGIPASVVATALNCPQEELEAQLHELRKSHVVSYDENLWAMKPLATPITTENAAELLAKSLSSLLSYIDSTPANANISTHILNVISLSKATRGSHPALVASVFTRLDKRLKLIGNKRLVWFVAHLSIQAARICDRDRNAVEAHARALICGTSRAFQRLHKIAKARIDADEAYQLAEGVRLDRTLAFCVKCRGRLSRMEAEQMPDGDEKRAKLNNSVVQLLEAVDRFGQLVEFGPNDPEVGDCFSLLGRTYLELGLLGEADGAATRANRLIVDQTSKDYIDLILLKGDIEAASGSRDSASQFYDEAILISASPDAEITEMHARAFYKRARNKEALGRMSAARSDYAAAAKIWESLHDEEFAAIASWDATRIGGFLSKNALMALSAECPDVKVRVEAARIHSEEIKSLGQHAGARRNEPGLNYWRQIARRAQERVVLRGEHSETEW